MRVAAMAALLALAATYLTPLVSVEWAAWRHDHGHITLSGTVAPHSHPWEREASSGASGADGEQTDIVFTTSGDTVPGMTVLWFMVPLLLAIVGVVTLASEVAVTRLASIHIAPALRPPKGFLSQPSIV